MSLGERLEAEGIGCRVLVHLLQGLADNMNQLFKIQVENISYARCLGLRILRWRWCLALTTTIELLNCFEDIFALSVSLTQAKRKHIDFLRVLRHLSDPINHESFHLIEFIFSRIQALILLAYILNLWNCRPPALRYLFETLVDFKLHHIPQYLHIEEDNNAFIELLHILSFKGRFKPFLRLLFQLRFDILYLKDYFFYLLHTLNLKTVILTLNDHSALLDGRR